MTQQLSLLPELTVAEQVVAPTVGRVRRKNPPTSKHAAQQVAFKVGALKHRILRYLAAQGAHGANDWELHVHCDPKGRVHSAATRREELESIYLVRWTAISRPTDNPSRAGFVTVITEAGLAVLAELEERAAA